MSEDLNVLRIQLTSPLKVESPRAVLDDRLFYGWQARLVFSILVLERERFLHRDELAPMLWPCELPSTWRSALRGIVSKVRGFLAVAGLPDNLSSGDQRGYRLRLPPDVLVDVEYARSAAETAEKVLSEGDHSRAVALAESSRMVALRPFLPDLKGQWVDTIRHGLSKVLLYALCVLAEGYGRLHQHYLAIRAAEDAIELEPFRERTHQLLMRMHSLAGNPAEALRTYHRCRRLLVEELGVEPTKETGALYLQLLRR